jgi:hypothetical protein
MTLKQKACMRQKWGLLNHNCSAELSLLEHKQSSSRLGARFVFMLRRHTLSEAAAAALSLASREGRQKKNNTRERRTEKPAKMFSSKLNKSRVRGAGRKEPRVLFINISRCEGSERMKLFIDLESILDDCQLRKLGSSRSDTSYDQL